MNHNMIFFLYGEDTWRKAQKIKQITERFVKEVDPSRLNVQVLEGASLDEEALRGALRAAPFLARKRLVVLKNLLSEGRRKGPLEVFQSSLEVFQSSLRDATSLSDGTTILVVSEDEGKPKKWKYPEAKAAWEYLEKHAQAEQFKPLSGAKLEAAIATQAKAHGLTMEKDAAELLAMLCAGDLGQSEQELQKLTAFCGQRPATAEDVQAVCIDSAQASIFAFLDALGNKDRTALMRTLADQLEDSEPTQLLARIGAHLRGLLAMTLAGEAGARALALHPFQAKKMMGQLRHWEAATLKAFLTRLMVLDYSIKRGLAADARTQLTTLLARVVVQ